MTFSPHLNFSDYILTENEAWKEEMSTQSEYLIQYGSHNPIKLLYSLSSFKSFIFYSNILCWSVEILPTGYSQIVCCNTNVYVLETVAGMCFLKKWVLKENKAIVPSVRWWKMVHCIFEIGIKLLQKEWQSREME